MNSAIRKEEYRVPEIELIEAIWANVLCQSAASYDGSTSDYEQDDEYIF